MQLAPEKPSCPVCLEDYGSAEYVPRILLCAGSHTICDVCIGRLSIVNGEVECPQCRQQAPARTNPNRDLLSLLTHLESQEHETREREAVLQAAARAAEEEAAAAERRATKAIHQAQRAAAAGRAAEKAAAEKAERARATQQAAVAPVGAPADRGGRGGRGRGRGGRGALVQQQVRDARRAARGRATSQNSRVLLIALSVAVALISAIWMWRRMPDAEPLDAHLSTVELWEEAKSAMDAGQHDAAAWLMLITMFLDFTYASGLNLHPPIRTVLAGCSNDNPAAIVLAPVLKETSDVHIDKWSKALKKLDRMPETKGAWLSSTPLSGGWFSGGENDLAFARACALLLDARYKYQIGQLLMQHEPKKTLRYFTKAHESVKRATKILQPERYLTLLFELSYSNRNTGGTAEAERWSEKFHAAMPSKLNAHWRQFNRRNKQGGETLESIRGAAAAGKSPEDILADTARKVLKDKRDRGETDDFMMPWYRSVSGEARD